MSVIGPINGPKAVLAQTQPSVASPREGERRGLGLVLGDGLKMGASGAIAGAVLGVIGNGIASAVTKGRVGWYPGSFASMAVIGAGGGGALGALLGMSGIVTPFRNEG